MKRTPSVVWRFFDRIEQDGRVVAIVCKLCDARYKYFGNTTNLRCHLVNKHPIQWELGQNETLEEGFRVAATDDETNQSTPRPRQKRYRKSETNDNVDVLESETDIAHDDDTQATINLVKQLHRGSDEEWLNEDVFDTVTETYTQPQKKRKIYRKIKREVISPAPTTYEPKKQIIIQNNRRDEYHAFGEYVSNKLRKFNNNQTQSNVQQLITTILWQAEYGVYDNMDTVKRILLHSMQDMGSPSQEGGTLHISHQELENMNVNVAVNPIAE
ncbi:uncharacterized protein LOC123709260 isoform X2 [Pieris brassicae]|uniref:BED-type domain-containing protein n=1 Tax=Pieris brassicae TaxID=7116 RepID=A0A9P0TCJ5_PIEBR|nr:uncharacterized protein LOC123709260 isoform X2 [Pieris brassicae]CAH4027617.1 unnamed protein product [Pieris brassicae]